MPFWTFFGLLEGNATTGWPRRPGPDGQDGAIGMPRFDRRLCEEDCEACVDICPTGAIYLPSASHKDIVEIDYGRCVTCQLCVEACHTGAFAKSGNWAFAVRDRSDLDTGRSGRHAQAKPSYTAPTQGFNRSLHIRHVDAGSCNGCESELQALNNPYYNLHKLGIFFTPSPRFADVLLVTGPVTYAMRDPLLQTYAAMPDPKWVVAVGTCAVSGGIAEGGYACGHGLEGLLPVDIYLPGCPPNPAAIIEALLLLLNRASQQVHGGQYGK